MKKTSTIGKEKCLLTVKASMSFCEAEEVEKEGLKRVVGGLHEGNVAYVVATEVVSCVHVFQTSYSFSTRTIRSSSCSPPLFPQITRDVFGEQIVKLLNLPCFIYFGLSILAHALGV